MTETNSKPRGEKETWRMDESQAIDLLWDEWKYRHALFWTFLFRWAGAVVTLWVIPFLKPEIFTPVPKLALVFPALAFALTLFSTWLLGAEQRRFAMVNQKYEELRRDHRPPRMARDTFLDRLFAAPIGAGILWLYCLAFATVSFEVGFLLWHHPFR
jgi:hypothetical protein